MPMGVTQKQKVLTVNTPKGDTKGHQEQSKKRCSVAPPGVVPPAQHCCLCTQDAPRRQLLGVTEGEELMFPPPCKLVSGVRVPQARPLSSAETDPIIPERPIKMPCASPFFLSFGFWATHRAYSWLQAWGNPMGRRGESNQGRLGRQADALPPTHATSLVINTLCPFAVGRRVASSARGGRRRFALRRADVTAAPALAAEQRGRRSRRWLEDVSWVGGRNPTPSEPQKLPATAGGAHRGANRAPALPTPGGAVRGPRERVWLGLEARRRRRRRGPEVVGPRRAEGPSGGCKAGFGGARASGLAGAVSDRDRGGGPGTCTTVAQGPLRAVRRDVAGFPRLACVGLAPPLAPGARDPGSCSLTH